MTDERMERERLAERLREMADSRRYEAVGAVCVMCGTRWGSEHKEACWVPDLNLAAALLTERTGERGEGALRPCPFCGEPAVLSPASDTDPTPTIPGCPACDVWGDDEAAWNRRAASPLEHARAVVEAMRDFASAALAGQRVNECWERMPDGRYRVTLRDRYDHVLHERFVDGGSGPPYLIHKAKADTR